MPVSPSTRLGLHAPSGGDPADVPRDILRLRDQLDAFSLGYGQGRLSDRPTTHLRGRTFYATDIATLYYDDGSVWHEVGAEAGSARIVGGVGQPAPANGWSAGSPAPRFWRQGSRVYLAGSMNTNGTVVPIAFTLPTGYRPSLAVVAAAAAQPDSLVPVGISTDGAVYAIFEPGVTSVALDGISFDTVR
ncbi:hypothetical protein [Conexibacter sp. CPCC 206217]|uniref:hypothetical protein n=1 Tax=Conexibacter sp. CPCC 206217 TaxID=3064574 RepID=UPI0027220559|nr:hypothetical protein [Conexibacter sp. CPCC 206217]MDO8209282.1 hypothetical protein [Conexibacter sp. CPCC 206217]